MRYFLTVKNHSTQPAPDDGTAFFRGLTNAFLLVVPMWMIIGVVIWMILG